MVSDPEVLTGPDLLGVAGAGTHGHALGARGERDEPGRVAAGC
jgi:hypothetical protein